jgi:hypothetical protein
MRKIKSYTVNIVWDDGEEELIYPNSQVRDAMGDYLDGLEDEENINITMEEQETCT